MVTDPHTDIYIRRVQAQTIVRQTETIVRLERELADANSQLMKLKRNVKDRKKRQEIKLKRSTRSVMALVDGRMQVVEAFA